jgi:hypothetical protein
MRRIFRSALLVASCLVAFPAAAADTRAAESFYDAWFGDFLHEEFVVDVARQIEQTVHGQVAAALGGESQLAACKGMQDAIAAFANDDLRPMLEAAHSDPTTRNTMVVALADVFEPVTLSAYAVQARVKGGGDLVKLQLMGNAAFAERLGVALRASPLNMTNNASARDRVDRSARERLAPAVQRCKAQAK